MIWQGRDLIALSPAEMDQVRAREIGMVFQEPMTSLNPIYRVGAQIAEAVRAHQRLSRGAALAVAVADEWRAVGERLGEAYQVADDIGDALADEAQLGKPVGQDAAHGRPNAVREFGVRGAIARLDGLTEAAVAAIPACSGAEALGALIRQEAHRLLPRPLPAFAA